MTHGGLYSIFATATHTGTNGTIDTIDTIGTNGNASIVPIMPIMPIMSIKKAMGILSLFSLNTETSFRALRGFLCYLNSSIACGALSRAKSKRARWGSLLLWNRRAGLDVLSIWRKPYLIDNKSFSGIEKATLTRFLTSLEMLEKVKIFKQRI